MINLIANSIDAVRAQAEKWIKIDVVEQSSGIVVKVIDSGVPISTELETKLFDPFFSTKMKGEGTGLGLSITKGILDEHNATIALDRSEATTCFTMQFPRVDEFCP